jgi:hypothetical protein
MGKITTLVVGMLVILLFTSGVFHFLGGLQAEYDIGDDGNFTSFYTSVNKSYANAQNLQTNFQNKLDANETLNPTGLFQWYSWIDWIFKSFAGTISAVSSSVDISGEMVSSAGSIFQISWAANIVIVIIGVSIVLAIVGYLINRNL